jgi:peptidoglycan/xylan/chitin deacetylase (PgdA/CDA1 family)
MATISAGMTLAVVLTACASATAIVPPMALATPGPERTSSSPAGSPGSAGSSSTSPTSQASPAAPSQTPLAWPWPSSAQVTLPTANPSPAASPSAEPSHPSTGLPSGAVLAPLVRHGSLIHRVIAITIDDGFSSQAVLADLAILERAHVNATWFPIGRVVARAPATWRMVARAGFPIGNHTYDHTLQARHSYAQILADIERDNAVVSRVIGRPLVPFLRPPGGSWSRTVLAAAAAAGERAVVMWSATTGDTAPWPSRSRVDLLVRNATRTGNGGIILMHANLPYTQLALPRIIAYYRSRGFEFVTLGQMFGIPGPVPFPPAP